MKMYYRLFGKIEEAEAQIPIAFSPLDNNLTNVLNKGIL